MRFAAEHSRVDGFEEWSHRIVFRHEQEIHRAVGARDVAVKANSEAEDDFALCASGGFLRWRFLFHAGHRSTLQIYLSVRSPAPTWAYSVSFPLPDFLKDRNSPPCDSPKGCALMSPAVTEASTRE